MKKLRKLLELHNENLPNSVDSHTRFAKLSNAKEELIDNVKTILKLCKNDCESIAQPIRHLPASKQFNVNIHHYRRNDPCLSLCKWIKAEQSLPMINQFFKNHLVKLSLLSPDELQEETKNLQQQKDLSEICLIGHLFLDLINSWIATSRGIALFTCNDIFENSGQLLKILFSLGNSSRGQFGQKNCQSMQMNGPQQQKQILGVHVLNEYKKPRQDDRNQGQDQMSENSCLDLLFARANDLALRLSYSMKVFQCIDRLFQFHTELALDASDDKLDNEDDVMKDPPSESCISPEEIFHDLMTIIDHPYGRDAFIKYMGQDKNLNCLLGFLLPSAENLAEKSFRLPNYGKKRMTSIALKQPSEVDNNNRDYNQDDYNNFLYDPYTCIEYSLELVEFFFKMNQTRVQQISDEYIDTLAQLSKSISGNIMSTLIASRIRLLLPWLCATRPLQSRQDGEIEGAAGVFF